MFIGGYSCGCVFYSARIENSLQITIYHILVMIVFTNGMLKALKFIYKQHTQDVLLLSYASQS